MGDLAAAAAVALDGGEVGGGQVRPPPSFPVLNLLHNLLHLFPSHVPLLALISSFHG